MSDINHLSNLLMLGRYIKEVIPFAVYIRALSQRHTGIRKRQAD
jgi:hypothetical protein